MNNVSFVFLFTVPDRCTNDIIGLEQFTRVFHARYGSTGPILYIGSLDQAIQDSACASRDEVNLFNEFLRQCTNDFFL